MVDTNEILDLKGVVRTLADYVMLNSVATDSTSLYYGRAGMSICLFEASRYLNDEYMENHAFTLLKQVLVNDNNDIRFDAGLSGIGYVLAYLIRNKFVEADFCELFQDQHNIIIDFFVRQDYDNMDLKDLIQLWQLMPYFYYIPCNGSLSKIEELQDVCIKRFQTEWKAIKKNTEFVDKELVASLWKLYLKVLRFANGKKSYQYICEYLNIVKDGLMKRDMSSLHFISNIDYIAREELVTCNISDFYSIDSLSFKNMFLEPYISQDSVKNRIYDMFNGVSERDLEQNLTRLLGYSTNSAALSFGVSGLLLGLIGLSTCNNIIITDILSII